MHPATVLVADDDAVARELLAEALKKEGYAVEAFASGDLVVSCMPALASFWLIGRTLAFFV